jgi:hypothetical protein
MVATSLAGSPGSGIQFVCEMVWTVPLSCATIGEGGIALTDLLDALDKERLDMALRGKRLG